MHFWWNKHEWMLWCHSSQSAARLNLGRHYFFYLFIYSLFWGFYWKQITIYCIFKLFQNIQIICLYDNELLSPGIILHTCLVNQKFYTCYATLWNYKDTIFLQLLNNLKSIYPRTFTIQTKIIVKPTDRKYTFLRNCMFYAI